MKNICNKKRLAIDKQQSPQSILDRDDENS